MKLQVEEIKKIVVFRALQLGDLMCSIPAIRSLKKAYPNAEITLVGLPWAKTFTERFNQYFHSFISFPGYPGLPEVTADYYSYPDFLKQVQQQNFDLAIQMQGDGTLTNPIVELFAAKRTAGFYRPPNHCPDKELFIEYPTDLHEIKRHLKLTEHLGSSELSTDLEFPLTAKDEEDFEKAALGVEPKNYVIIHPGARSETRQWPVKYFAVLADRCIEKGFKAVITGTKDEAPIVNAVIEKMKHTPINATGKTSLGAVGVLVKNAHGLVSNCTGVSHIAAAFKTKSVVISMHGEPKRWNPLNAEIHASIDWTTNKDFNNVMEKMDWQFFS